MTGTVDFNRLDSLGLTRKEPLKKEELGQDQFLELMTAQLKNQDPMKPMENGEFLGQIAQFASVRGIQDLQKTFSQLADSLVSNQALQASSLVGRSVLVASDVGQLNSEGTINGAVELENGADEVFVNITDTVGQQVRQMKLGAHEAGLAEFSWDGLNEKGESMPAGLYKIQAAAFVSGQQIGTETLITAPVTSVSVGGGGVSVNLEQMGLRDFGDVREIR